MREGDGLRWYRCLRCDSWLPLPEPGRPNREHLPGRDEIELPLRGRPLRDRYVLRLIALERVVHFLVFAAIAAGIFLFAQNRAQLHNFYNRVVSDLQGGLSGPINTTGTGGIADINKLFSLSSTELYLIGIAVAAYACVIAAEAIGLWFARRWAAYLTFVETGILVPFEIYELSKGVSVLKVLVLAINLAVVIYLLVSKRLFGLRGGARAEQEERQADTGWGALERAIPLVGSTPESAPVRPS